jgi:chloramphenicol 3-O-phosphotransferase
VSARIIILNGVGSVGKSSIAKAFQTITTEPFLHIAMDAFIDMLPKGMIGHPDGISFRGGTGSGQANYCHQVWAGDAASDARHAPRNVSTTLIHPGSAFRLGSSALTLVD